ncbi:SDR family NAD(P)-dependent oxidoreductase [Rhodococcus erythropolis]|uniref:SDR family NAD(P)-dependent oxidoreductase n=1 Tax=Rhodococcus erythropolis TaxID=1833 RepID=UPI00380EA023
MDLGLSGKRVVVTGGGANIGREISRGFAREGARVMVVDLDAEQAHQACSELKTLGAKDAVALPLDLTADGAGMVLATRVTEQWGGVDVLVNNAGWSKPGWFAQQTDRELWQKTVDVNLFAAIDCTQAVLAPMREAGGGAIVFLSSDAAFGAIRQGIYGAAKAGLISLARTVAREHGRHGIRSNVLAPGLVVPPAEAVVGENSVWAAKDAIFTQDQIDSVINGQALRRQTTPGDIANAVLWLSSDTAARQVTGQVLAVGGGSSMP